MTTAWIAYSLLVGALLAATARWLESAARLAGRPTRWVWAAALALTVALSFLAPHRADRDTGLVISTTYAKTSGVAPITAAPRVDLFSLVGRAERALVARTQDLLSAAGRTVPASVEVGIAIAWLAASVGLVLLFVGVSARYQRARRRWPVADVQGTRVRIAPEAGPAVVGLSKPEIVVPRWLLLRSDEEQRIVLAHEREHVLARDPLMLAAACGAVALLPWHPAVWWMLSRLQLAVELDCDERVLRRGVAPRSYGSLLIDLAGRSSGLPVGAPALADRPSHLERRLLAMKPQRPRFARARGGMFAALALVALVAACEAKMPTSAEVADLDVAKAEQSAHRVSFMKIGDSTSTYTIDGRVATSAEAKALAPTEIGSIQVERKSIDGVESGQVNIRTRAALGLPPGTPGDTSMHMKMMVRHLDGAGMDSLHREMRIDGGPAEHMRNFDGVVVIDGKRVDHAAMAALSPADIVSIEVIKGPAAKQMYDAPEAANGVIKIVTKKGAQH